MRPKFTLKFVLIQHLVKKKSSNRFRSNCAESDPAAIFVLNGYAGTGKTTLIAALVRALKDCGIKPVLLAPTGRAAKVLSRYSGEPALTIHKRIYRQRTNADYESKFSLNINQERGAVFIVDEASMLANGSSDGAIFGSGALLDDLVSYVRGGRDCRLILVGDQCAASSDRGGLLPGTRSEGLIRLWRGNLHVAG